MRKAIKLTLSPLTNIGFDMGEAKFFARLIE
jgi:hypothetical protein